MLSPMAHPGVRSPDRDQRPERHSGQEAPRCEESVVRSRRMRPDGLSHMQTRRLLARGSQSNPGWSAESPQCGTHAFTSLLDGRLLTPGTWLLGWSTKSQSRSRSEEHTSELQSLAYLVCRLLLEKKKKKHIKILKIKKKKKK